MQQQQAQATASTTTEPSLWDKANTAYINGDFQTAVTAYEQMRAAGEESAKLDYNLADAYFKQSQIGKAVLFYHRALRLSPGDDDIRYNLGIAQSHTKDNIEAIPAFFFTEWMQAVRHTMSCTAWTVLSLVFLACMLAAFLLYLLARRLPLRKAGFYGTAVAVVLFVLTTLFAMGARREMLDKNAAVVMAQSISVKSSPDNASTDLFVLHEGTTVRITSRLDTWCEIVLADGKKGWLPNKQIEVI